MNDYLKEYKYTVEDLGDCFFYKVQVDFLRINIQEDKEGKYNFFSIREGNVSKTMLYYDGNKEKMYEDIKKYIESKT